MSCVHCGVLAREHRQWEGTFIGRTVYARSMVGFKHSVILFKRVHGVLFRQADPPDVELDIRNVSIPIADLPINCDPPSFVETQAVMNRLKWGKAPGICAIYAEHLKAGGNIVLVLLQAVLCSVWNTGIITTDWKRDLVVPLWKGKGDCQDCNNYRGVTLLSARQSLCSDSY